MPSQKNFACPVCGNALEPVGKKALRMRCRSCRSVFDKSQLEHYYGYGIPDEGGVAAHDHETKHMHERELAQQAATGRVAGSTRNQNRTENAIRQAEAIRTIQQTKTGSTANSVNAGKVIFWVFLFLFLIGPMLTGIIGVILEDAFEDSDFDWNSNENSAIYNAGNENANKVDTIRNHSSANSNTSADNGKKKQTFHSQDMFSNIKAYRATDTIYGDIVIFELDWKNFDEFGSSFAGAVKYEAWGDGTLLLSEALPTKTSSNMAKYDPDVRFTRIDEGKTQHMWFAFQLPENNSKKTIELKLADWNEYLDQGWDIGYTQTFDISKLPKASEQ